MVTDAGSRYIHQTKNIRDVRVFVYSCTCSIICMLYVHPAANVFVVEITQDIASKGLGVVYEKCSAEQKQVLVTSLVDTLSTGAWAFSYLTVPLYTYEH